MAQETDTLLFSTPHAAETAFYRAIEKKDTQMMDSVWLPTDQVVCIHPMGARLQGRQDVMDSWQQIFSSDSALSFEIRDVSQQLSKNLAVHILHERIVSLQQMAKPTVVEATNVYKLTDDGWKMILHHASLSAELSSEIIDLNEDMQETVLH